MRMNKLSKIKVNFKFVKTTKITSKINYLLMYYFISITINMMSNMRMDTVNTLNIYISYCPMINLDVHHMMYT
ncbi:hypothetical protein Presley_2 [Acinetobacter phage Presley]|uniref:Uncharacterized protein n=1 Tax=Acinetobacter phage Presley TaxID=1406780 RepID=U5PVY4_9CAUD|nr:hypothetical protein Presley_2 [Acinetobacter phage Presley]AGY48069.1 hypothetical protein Presley_2 [Acinetobacter phage Presley]